MHCVEMGVFREVLVAASSFYGQRRTASLETKNEIRSEIGSEIRSYFGKYFRSW